MRFAAFLLVLAVALGAFLVLRSPTENSGGVSPDAGASAPTEGTRAPLDLARGDGAAAGRSQIASGASSTPGTKKPGSAAPPVELDKAGPPAAATALEALSAANIGIDDLGMTQKYDRTTSEQRRQALATIRQQLEFGSNLEPKEIAVLKNEIEWLERSLDS